MATCLVLGLNIGHFTSSIHPLSSSSAVHISQGRLSGEILIDPFISFNRFIRGIASLVDGENAAYCVPVKLNVTYRGSFDEHTIGRLTYVMMYNVLIVTEENSHFKSYSSLQERMRPHALRALDSNHLQSGQQEKIHPELCECNYPK